MAELGRRAAMPALSALEWGILVLAASATFLVGGAVAMVLSGAMDVDGDVWFYGPPLLTGIALLGVSLDVVLQLRRPRPRRWSGVMIAGGVTLVPTWLCVAGFLMLS